MNQKTDVKIIKSNTDSIIIINAKRKWYKRIWIIITNPFLYVFSGKIRY